MALIKLYTARDGMEAHFLRSLLEEAGIRAAVMGESLAVGRGDLPLTQETLPAVWIDDADAERAAPMLREVKERGAPSASPPWTCPACGEVIEGQFTSCWNCGAEKPVSSGTAT